MLREKTIFIKLIKIIFTKSTKISKRKLSRMVIFALLCSSINFINNTYAKERSIDESDLSAKAAVLIDGENGRILFGKNEKEKRAENDLHCSTGKLQSKSSCGNKFKGCIYAESENECYER